VTHPSVLPKSAEHHGATVVLLILLILSGTLSFFRLGTPGLFDADEPAYAQAAREMLETGDWITPHFNGLPRFDKPILFYWLITLSYRVFGVTEFAVRFWSALAAVILVLTIAWAGRRWFGPPADLLSGLALTTNLLTALLARAAVTDMLLTLFVTLAILAGVEALRESAPGTGWATIGWIAMGLAVLVKGPVGFVIPAMALGGSLFIFHELRRGLNRLLPWQGLLLFATITLPWYILVLAANGWTFVEGFVIKHHVSRFTGVISSHAGPLWFYLPVALVGFFPWSAYLPRAFWQAGAVARRREAREHSDRLLVVCACWAAGVFIFFSLAGTKLPSYLFPAFPAMALLVGAAGVSNGKPTTENRSTGGNDRVSVVRCPFSVGRGQPPQWLDRLAPWLIGTIGGALALGFGMVPWILDALRPRVGGLLDGTSVPFGLAWWPAGLVALGTAGSLLVRGVRRVTILATMMSLLIFTAEMGAPLVYAVVQGPLREFAEDAHQILGGEGTLVVYGLNAPSIVFYTGHSVTSLGSNSPDGLDQVRRLIEAGRPLVVITRIVHVTRLDAVPGLIRLKAYGGYAIYSSLRR
jgi:4-amino-4-deoxy-L-arabinose transferase-like glycosyltransferase